MTSRCGRWRAPLGSKGRVLHLPVLHASRSWQDDGAADMQAQGRGWGLCMWKTSVSVHVWEGHQAIRGVSPLHKHLPALCYCQGSSLHAARSMIVQECCTLWRPHPLDAVHSVLKTYVHTRRLFAKVPLAGPSLCSRPISSPAPHGQAFRPDPGHMPQPLGGTTSLASNLNTACCFLVWRLQWFPYKVHWASVPCDSWTVGV